MRFLSLSCIQCDSISNYPNRTSACEFILDDPIPIIMVVDYRFSSYNNFTMYIYIYSILFSRFYQFKIFPIFLIF